MNPYIESFLRTTRVAICVRKLQAFEMVRSFVQLLQVYIFIVYIYVTLYHQSYNVCFFIDTKYSTGFGHSQVVRETYYEIVDYMKFTKICVDKCFKIFELYYGMYINSLHNS
jgi:hypothetical protein